MFSSCLSMRSLSTVAAIAGFSIFSSSSAGAAEQIVLKYQDIAVPIATEDLRAFAETGEPPFVLQLFLNSTEKAPEEVSQWLTKELEVPGLQTFLDTTTGEFVLNQVDEVITGASDLRELKMALNAAAADDDRLSMLEVLEAHPSPEVTIDVTRLEPLYHDIEDIVEQVLPILQTAGEYL